MYDKDDMSAAVQHRQEINELFFSRDYVAAYKHYMSDPNGGGLAENNNTSFEQFIGFMSALKNSNGTPITTDTFSLQKYCRTDNLGLNMVANGFKGENYETLVALVNEASPGSLEPFAVSHEGYEFEAVYEPGEEDDEDASYAVKLKVTPLDWAQAAVKLGYDIVNVHPHVWRFTKPGAVGLNNYDSPGEAAKAACIFNGAGFADGACQRPDKLITLTINHKSNLVVGQEGTVYARNKASAGEANYQVIDVKEFEAFWGRPIADGDHVWMAPYLDENGNRHAIDYAKVINLMANNGEVPTGALRSMYIEAFYGKAGSVLSAEHFAAALDDDEFVHNSFANKLKIDEALQQFAERLDALDGPSQ